MRFILAIVMVLMMSIVALAGDRPTTKPTSNLAAKVKFISKNGKYSAMLPPNPEEYALDTPNGKLHMVAAQSEHAMYSANYCDFPEKVQDLPLEDFYNSPRDGAVANLGGKFLSEKSVQIREHPGREIQILTEGDMIFRARIYLVGRRLFQIVILAEKKVATSKEADEFLGSLKLIED